MKKLRFLAAASSKAKLLTFYFTWILRGFYMTQKYGQSYFTSYSFRNHETLLTKFQAGEVAVLFH